MNFLMNWYADDAVSAIHHALRPSRRRLCVVIVAERVSDSFSGKQSVEKCYDSENGSNVELTVREIARQITAIEQGVSIDYATGEEYHNVYNSLIQSHLSRLDAIEGISYNSERKTVRPGQNLFPLLVAVTTTSPIRILFRTSTADLYAGGTTSHSSTDDSHSS
jgi:hypothetical protein